MINCPLILFHLHNQSHGSHGSSALTFATASRPPAWSQFVLPQLYCNTDPLLNLGPHFWPYLLRTDPTGWGPDTFSILIPQWSFSYSSISLLNFAIQTNMKLWQETSSAVRGYGHSTTCIPAWAKCEYGYVISMHMNAKHYYLCTWRVGCILLGCMWPHCAFRSYFFTTW